MFAPLSCCVPVSIDVRVKVKVFICRVIVVSADVKVKVSYCRVIVVAFTEKIAAFDALDLKEKFCVTCESNYCCVSVY